MYVDQISGCGYASQDVGRVVREFRRGLLLLRLNRALPWSRRHSRPVQHCAEEAVLCAEESTGSGTNGCGGAGRRYCTQEP
ncbi:hypothetical protein NDU88_005874 [Pleurodeles waltl]|uniref:Uncharacterized protein n=1 Tax=Pleurodeles waltl TaxID=8319 RepID=A0AAV7NSN4_PLEWA|nr:hypothetical protein NDU88_005874 [Pleurodeles waltl]